MPLNRFVQEIRQCGKIIGMVRVDISLAVKVFMLSEIFHSVQCSVMHVDEKGRTKSERDFLKVMTLQVVTPCSDYTSIVAISIRISKKSFKMK